MTQHPESRSPRALSPRPVTLLAALSALVPLAAGCGGDVFRPDCPATLSLVASPSVVVEPVDSASGAPVEGAAGWWIVDGASDSLRAFTHTVEGGALSLGAYGPTGRYALLVRREGYRDWAASGVRVEAGACGPRTVTLRARMQRP